MRERVNTTQACRLYQRLRTWPAVARIMKRRDGTKFQTQSIMRAVRTQDKAVCKNWAGECQVHCGQAALSSHRGKGAAS